MIDVVLTYVDNNDKTWRHDYLVYSKIEKEKYEPNNVRFRSWDNLQYVFRSIEQYIPFVNNVYLIVAKDSQVPNFINTNIVKIVYHKEIIPHEYLPTFNSNTIELFMYKIPDLSENFIYLNDDIFFLNKYEIKDFYDTNMNPIVMVNERMMKKENTYRTSLLNTMKLAQKENNKFKLKCANHILRSDHSPNPMKKSMWEYYWKKYNEELYKSISRFRKPTNITQELSNYHFYMYYNSNNINCCGYRNSKYFEFVNNTSEDLKYLLYNKNISSICINDAGVIDFEIYKNVTNKLLEKRFPNKSIYEI